jgi:putative DNA primase/helicase
VSRATDAYREEMDMLGDFIAEACEHDPTGVAPMGSLYAAYQSYCGVSREKPMSKRAFGEALTERGFISDREGHAGPRIRRGLRLLGRKAQPEDERYV